MIDILGIIGSGYYNQNPESNGIFICNDNSVIFGYKVPGIKFYTMNENERITTYSKLRDTINQLDNYENGEGCFYQFMSQPNYDISDLRDKSMKSNAILKDKTFKTPPFLFKEILDKNTNDSFDLFEKYQYSSNDNYIFVRFYFNLGKRKVEDYFSFIKELFELSSAEENETISDLNEAIDNKISMHNSKFSELNAVPLNILEMINVMRKYLGFSVLKTLPAQNMDETFYKFIFPGEIEFNPGYIKTQEKIKMNFNNKKLETEKENKFIKDYEERIKKDLYLIEHKGIAESSKMEHDLNYIYFEIFNISEESCSTLSMQNKYYGLRDKILEVNKVCGEKEYSKFKYFDKSIFNLYIFKNTYYKNTRVENNDTYIRVYSVNEIPSTLSMFHGDSLNSMYGDFSMTLNFKKLPDSETVIKMRRQIVLEKIKVEMPVMKWFLPIESIMEKIELLRTVMREIDNADYSRVEANIYLTLRSNTEKDNRERDIGSFESKNGLNWVKENDNAPFHILTNSMPGCLSKFGLNHSRRVFLLNSSNIAQFSPLINEETGSKDNIMTVAGYSGLISLDLNQAPAGHLSIAGSTGGGKSVLGNKLILENKKNGDVVITTEKGNSFTRSTIFFGGKVYKPDMSGRIKINPFVMPLGTFEEEEIRKQIYSQMVAAMSQMCNNYTPSMQNLYYKIIRKAFEGANGQLNKRFVKNNAVTPTQLLSIMNAHPDFQNLSEELSSFEAYTINGAFGSIFDGNEGLDLDYPLINIDYSGLQEAGIKDFVFKSLLQNIFNEMSKAQGRKRFFNLNDEFWDAIKSSGAANSDTTKTAIGQIESFFRVARKLGGKIGVISQGVSEIADSPLKSAVFNNVYHSFFSNINSALELDQIKSIFRFEDSQIQEIKNLSMVKGKYSEYFVSAPYGERLAGNNTNRDLRTKFKYYPTSLEIALFTTHPKEVDLYNYMYSELGFTGDSSSVSQDIVMKSVRLFMEILPQGSDTNLYFQEKLYQFQQDFRHTFKSIVEERFGTFKNAFEQLTWESYINS
jgi:hypothetical protein